MYPLWHCRDSNRPRISPCPVFDPLMVVPLGIMLVEDEDDAVLVDGDSMEIVDELGADNQEVEEGIHDNLAMVEVEGPPPLNVVQDYQPLLLHFTTTPVVSDMLPEENQHL
ncbi:hypothetical protein AMTR_s00017p00216490 [Amborella trichopoda]|uniref:Uncharacterized protein n=1 Tax=Amborella trichopoda TaxID=13333 RepID=W1PFC8_AMBTC|nr:hypothetical protein AMTR_s00017p00216490 [Amborella trichopoda]